MTLTYIYHDCFLLQTDRCAIVFDYYREPEEEGVMLRGDVRNPAFATLVDKSHPLYVFVSHHHKDHFTSKIFEWVRWHKDIRYVISYDVARMVRHILSPGGLYRGVRPSPEQVVVMEPGEEYADELLKVIAFGSTDIGCSWYIDVNGRGVFHAGDLNAWLWRDESTPCEIAEAQNAYRCVLGNIREKVGKMDLCMFPVDSRIGSGYWEGGVEMLSALEIKRFIPMHFCLAENVEERRKRMRDVLRFYEYVKGYAGEIINLLGSYSSITI